MTSRNWNDLLLWTVAIACTALTLGFSLIPPPTMAASTMSDKPWHFLAYFFSVGSLLLAAVWRPGRGEGRFPRAAAPIVGVAVAVGVGLELIQGTLPNRQMELADGVANTLGVLAALGAWAVLRSLGTRSRRPG